MACMHSHNTQSERVPTQVQAPEVLQVFCYQRLISLFLWCKEVWGDACEDVFDDLVFQRGASPIKVVERLRSLGFKPLQGYYDHVYDWGRKVEIEDVLQIATSAHGTLKDFKVLYKWETE